MSREYLILIAVAIAIIGIIASVVALKPVLEISTEGVVKVSSKVVEINLTIDSNEGTASYNLGTIKLSEGDIIVKSLLNEYEGEFNLSVSGELILESYRSKYKILMPCMINVGSSCYRIMMVIPGYDTPLHIKADTYNATLILRWIAEGSGRFHAKIILEYTSFTEGEIEVIGIKPEVIDGWIVAENSTKTYSMLVNTNNTTSGKVLLWIWVFNPNNGEPIKARVTVLNELSNQIIANEEVTLSRDGPYWSALLQIIIGSKGNYSVRCYINDIYLTTKITVC